MKLEYFNQKSWAEVSREERFFCAELYYQLKKDIKPFLNLISCDVNKEYDIGFEVCFYRDVLYEFGMKVREEKFSEKRTFDLALLAQDEIIIIEAKCRQGFEGMQLGYIKEDKTHIIDELFKKIGKPPVTVRCAAIISSKYSPSTQTKDFFKEGHKEKIITWKTLAVIYPNARELFERADAIYK